MDVVVRAARAEDAALLPDIERSAAGSFRALPDLAWIADQQPTPAEGHLPSILAGLAWVAEDADGLLHGFLTAERAGSELHIVEVSVLSQHQGRGIGRRLIDAARTQAETVGLSAITLTTFRDVPWNGPFYARLGFEMVPTSSIDRRLGAILAEEAKRGLPHGRRCAMRHDLKRHSPR